MHNDLKCIMNKTFQIIYYLNKYNFKYINEPKKYLSIIYIEYLCHLKLFKKIKQT